MNYILKCCSVNGFHIAAAVNPVTNRIYVANNGSADVLVIDVATNDTATVVAGDAPRALAVNPVTNKIYVANYNSGSVTVIDGDDKIVTERAGYYYLFPFFNTGDSFFNFILYNKNIKLLITHNLYHVAITSCYIYFSLYLDKRILMITIYLIYVTEEKKINRDKR